MQTSRSVICLACYRDLQNDLYYFSKMLSKIQVQNIDETQTFLRCKESENLANNRQGFCNNYFVTILLSIDITKPQKMS